MVPRVVPTVVAMLGLCSVIVGVVMLTLVAPPQQVGGAAGASEIVSTAPGVLSLTSQQVEVSIDGGGQDSVFVGVTRAADAQDWLDGLAQIRVDDLQDETTLQTQELAGDAAAEADPAADPFAADIWQQELSEADPSLTLTDPSPDQVLVAVAAEPVQMTLTWQRSARHPGAWPSVVGGVVVVGLALLWLAVLNARAAALTRRRSE